MVVLHVNEQEFKKVVRNLKLKESGAGIEGAIFGHIEMHKIGGK